MHFCNTESMEISTEITMAGSSVFSISFLLFFPLAVVVAIEPSASCMCSKFQEDYNKLKTDYENYQSSVLLDMKDIFGNSCSFPLNQLNRTAMELAETKKILETQTDAFTALIMAAANNIQKSANLSFPNATGEASDLTSFACFSGRPINVCFWVETKRNSTRKLVRVDRQTALKSDENYTRVEEGTLYADASGLEQGSCGLAVWSSENGTSHWSCTLITDDGNVYQANVKIKDGKATSKAVSAFQITITHLLLQFLLLFSIIIWS